MQDRAYDAPDNGARSPTIVAIERQVLSESAAGSTVREVYTIRVPRRMPRRAAKRASVRLVDSGRSMTFVTMPRRACGRVTRSRAPRRARRVSAVRGTSPPSSGDGPSDPPSPAPAADLAVNAPRSPIPLRSRWTRSLRRCALLSRYLDASAASVLAAAAYCVRRGGRS